MAHNKSRALALFTALIASAVVVVAVVVTVVMLATGPRVAQIAPAAGTGAMSAPDSPVFSDPVRACDYADLVGQKADTIDKARFGKHPVRVLTPGMMVTMEYMEGRVNLMVDDHGVITSVTCG